MFELALVTVDVRTRGDILQVRDEQFTAGRVHDVEWLGFFRDHVLQRPRVLWIPQDHSAVGCVLVGVEQKLVADIVDEPEAVVANLRDDRLEGGVGAREVAIEERVALLAFPAVGDRQDAVALILGDLQHMKTLRIGRVFICQHVLGLWRADLVVVDAMVLVLRGELFAFFRCGITAVVKPGPSP